MFPSTLKHGVFHSVKICISDAVDTSLASDARCCRVPTSVNIVHLQVRTKTYQAAAIAWQSPSNFCASDYGHGMTARPHSYVCQSSTSRPSIAGVRRYLCSRMRSVRECHDGRPGFQTSLIFSRSIGRSSGGVRERLIVRRYPMFTARCETHD